MSYTDVHAERSPGSRTHVRLRLAGDHVELVADGSSGMPGQEAKLSLGYRSLANTCFAHWPPSPAEIENAINLVEDAIALARWQHEDASLVIDPECVKFLLDSWATPIDDTMWMSRDDIERAFQELASASLSFRAGLLGPVKSREDAAVLLLLRELMHHLGFEHVVASGYGKESVAVWGNEVPLRAAAAPCGFENGRADGKP